MILLLVGIVGLLAALFIHWITWHARLSYLSLTVIAGALSALGLTSFFLLYLTSDIAGVVLIVMIVLWAMVLGIGSLQARALHIPWWKGVLALFFEVGLAFLAGAAVNLSLQKYISWLDQHFPGIDVYALINSFLWGLTIPLLVLAVIRPLMLLEKRKAKRD
jgi:hypothetical protein